MRIDGLTTEQILARRALLLAADRSGNRRERHEFMARNMLPVSKVSYDNRITLVRFALEVLGWYDAAAEMRPIVETLVKRGNPEGEQHG